MQDITKFIRFILLSSLFFLILWIVAELGVGIVDTNYSHKYRHVQNNPAITTLLTGASLFANGLNPHFLQNNDSIYDFATAGRWIYWDVRLAEKLFPTMPNLQIVLFPIGYDVMYYSLHYRKCRPEDETDIYNYTKYMKVYYDRLPYKYTCHSALYTNQMGFRLWKGIEYDSMGFMPLKGQAPIWEVPAIKPEVLQDSTSQKCYREYRDYLKDLARVCHDNNIRLIAVTPPCANSYLENVQPQGIQNIYNLIDSIRPYYPIEYRNYLDDAEFRTDSIYYNANHLNSVGADIFALRVKKDFGL